LSINNEREFRVSLLADLNAKHAKELHDLNHSSYHSLLISQISKCVSNFVYDDVQSNEYLKTIFDTLCHDNVFIAKSDIDHAWYAIDNNIFNLSNSQLLKILNDIQNEYNILLSDKGMR
jgi:hypothetical protein